MYDELIKRLREDAREQCFVGCFGICESCRICEELKQAADTIEELQKNFDEGAEREVTE